jgi:hypothetical protein
MHGATIAAPNMILHISFFIGDCFLFFSAFASRLITLLIRDRMLPGWAHVVIHPFLYQEAQKISYPHFIGLLSVDLRRKMRGNVRRKRGHLSSTSAPQSAAL